MFKVQIRQSETEKSKETHADSHKMIEKIDDSKCLRKKQIERK